jgi:tRNA-dihydrouridine synthase
MAKSVIYLAPLRGVTGLTFRQAFVQHMTGLDLAVAPFIATTQGPKVKPEVLKSIDPAIQPPTLPLVPQVIGKDPQQLRVMLKAMQALGYKDVDLNAGCPWPFVAKKGRGSGLLKDEKVLAAMLEAGCETLGPGHFSIKVRLGLEDKELLLKRLDTIQSFPLRELCVHPRTAKQMYEGTVDLDAFARVAERVTLPLVYNGDIKTPKDFFEIKNRFPQIKDYMVGRGVLKDPLLFAKIRGLNFAENVLKLFFLKLEEFYLKDFLEVEDLDSLPQYKKEKTEKALSDKMKELSSYLFPDLFSQIAACKDVNEINAIVSRRFQ